MKNRLFPVFLLTLLLLLGWSTGRTYATVSSGAVMTLSAATDAAPSDSTRVASATGDNSDKPFDWKGMIIGLLVLGFYFYAITWIVITMVKTKKIVPVNKTELIQHRKLANKAEEASEEENKKAFGMLEDAFYSWKVVSGPGEEEMRSPMTMAQIKKSKDLHASAEALMPTDEEVVNRLNELGNVLNIQEKRSFSGSWKLIIVALVATFITYLMSRSSDPGFWSWLKHFWWMPLGIVMYYFASMAPQFLQDKRARWFRGKNIHNVLIGTVLGLFLATPATETWVTKWSDGRRTKSEEINPFFLVMMAITFIVILLLGFFTIVFAGINFIRNYVVYV
jgi:hypothetical protein